MMRDHFLSIMLLAGFLGLHSTAPVQSQTEKELAQLARGFLKDYCSKCHSGANPEVEDYEVLSYKNLTKKRVSDGTAWYYVQPGLKGEAALHASTLWNRAGLKGKAAAEQDMPPNAAAVKPTDKERQEILQRWLEAGAPEWIEEKIVDRPRRPVNRDEGELWFDVQNILDTKCLSCHAGANSTSGVDLLLVSSFESLTKPWTQEVRNRNLLNEKNPWKNDEPWYYAKQGTRKQQALDASLLWHMIDTEKMPKGASKLTRVEKLILREWLEAGAPQPVLIPARKHLSPAMVESAILKHVAAVPREDQLHLRFFSLTHLQNNPRVRPADLVHHRAALSKLLNSLSWQPDLVLPTVVPETEEAVLAVDLRALGWKAAQWSTILEAYPYSIVETTSWPKEMLQRTGSSLPLVRADWFVARACRPPLYHALLGLPNNAPALEEKLGINFIDNFRKGKLLRAGYEGASTTTSGFRVIERQEIARYPGAFWRSYDFGRKPLGKGEPESNPLRDPLGPLFTKHPFPDKAFKHDGNEIIFNLPNGMQGYMVTDGKGIRMDAPPESILMDKNQFSGTTALLNGISCIACHASGMQKATDQVRNELDAKRDFGGGENLIRAIYVPKAILNQKLEADEVRFVSAAYDCTFPFDGKLPDSREEIILAAHKRYHANVGVEEAARELGYADPAEFLKELATDKLKGLTLIGRLRQENGQVKRGEWAEAFREVARRLGRGSAIVELK